MGTNIDELRMPPKGKGKDQKKQNNPNKVKEDKTFGLKNKNKSSKVQSQVARLKQEDAQRGKNREDAKKASDKEALAARKEREAKKKAELNELFKPLETIQQPKVPFGVDPKSLVCAFYKAGRCEKGSKCKYSHDLGVERKSAKANIYEDQRDETKDKDTMDKWDDEKLRQVVETKRNGQTTTDIVCKHFINAVENGTYGWFWTCPDGGDQCKYRHALPPGFVLKSQQKRDEEEANKQTITLEEFLETARHKLDQSKLTPITKESFAKWKQTRMDKREAEESAIRKTKEATAASGRATGMSGRDLFSFNPTFMGEDSDDDGDDDDWDLQAFREQTERDRAKAEEDRLRALGYDVGNMSIEDTQQDS